MEIIFVRHAQPDWEPGGFAVDDPGLTELGHAQARCTADALAGIRFDVVYTSPLRRVVETAAPILEKLGMEPQVHSWLRELELPSLHGRTRSQVAAFFSQANARKLDQWWDGFPGGESFRHFTERVTAGIEGLLVGDHRLGIHEDDLHRLWQVPDDAARVLVVAHEGTIGVALSHLLGIPPVSWAPARFSCAWTGISRIHTIAIAGAHVWSLEAFNRTEHLDPLRDRNDFDRDGRHG